MKYANIKLTIVIPTKNEEKNLPNCLMAIKNVDQIIVLDSDSTDQTPQIAKQFNVEYINFSWDGHYPKKRNWYMLNHSPRNKWIMFLDADEILNDSDLQLIACAIQSDKYSGYWLSYKLWFMGSPLLFGEAERKLALFKHGYGLYQKSVYSNSKTLDMEIHEHPIVSGKIGYLNTKINHHDYKGIDAFITKHLRYAEWEIEQLHNPETLSSSQTLKQKIKRKFLRSVMFSPLYFIYNYIFRGGFLDGINGFCYAFMKAWYFHVIYIKYHVK